MKIMYTIPENGDLYHFLALVQKINFFFDM